MVLSTKDDVDQGLRQLELKKIKARSEKVWDQKHNQNQKIIDDKKKCRNILYRVVSSGENEHFY